MNQNQTIVLKKYLTKKIKEVRKSLGLTQEEMAEKMDISTRSYVDIEHGISLCKTVTLFQFLSFCDLELNQMQKEIKQLLDSVCENTK